MKSIINQINNEEPPLPPDEHDPPDSQRPPLLPFIDHQRDRIGITPMPETAEYWKGWNERGRADRSLKRVLVTFTVAFVALLVTIVWFAVRMR